MDTTLKSAVSELTVTDSSGGSRSGGRLEVSVVIPCLNEAQSIAACVDQALAAFDAEGIRGEVVVSDNGSTDGSIEIAETHGARVVHATVKGYGSALRKGIEEARGEFIILGDADPVAPPQTNGLVAATRTAFEEPYPDDPEAAG